MLRYTTSASFSFCPAETVLEQVLTVLATHGFHLQRRDHHSAILSGPGLRSTRQSPLLGASTIDVEIQGQNLVLDAQLGGVASMQRFLTWFPLLLGLGLALLFGVVGGLVMGQKFGVGFGVPWAQGWQWVLFAFGVALLPVSPWIFITPLMSRSLEKRTEAALTTLAQNATQPSKPKR